MTSLDISTFVLNFANQFECTDIHVFNPETDFWSLDEWSSIVALSIVSMINEEYGIFLTSSDVKKARTIEELFIITQNKLK